VGGCRWRENRVVNSTTVDDEGARPAGGDEATELVARIAEMLPGLEGERLGELASALDELTEAVGLRLALDEES